MNITIIVSLPETSLDTVVWSPLMGTCEEGCFSGLSGNTIEPDGTRAARSGGWSFPTGGFSYKGDKTHITCV